MAGRFETWLAGGKAAAPAEQPAPKRERGKRHPGQRYGLPASGPGSVASLGRRLIGLVVDCVLAELIASLFVRSGPGVSAAEHAQALNYWGLLTWFLITVIGTGFFAVTPGMALVRVRVARVDGAPMLMPLRAIVRAVLVAVVVPAVIWDVDRRGLHDKAAGTIVLRTGGR